VSLTVHPQVRLGKHPRRAQVPGPSFRPMHRPSPPFVLLAVAVATAAAAPSSGAAAAVDYRHAADVACAKYDRTTNALPPITSAAEMKRQVVLVPKLFGVMAETIAALKPPAGKSPEAKRLVASLRVIGVQLGKIRDAYLHQNQAAIAPAVRAGEAASKAAVTSARALGLPACSKLAADATKGASG
jgi:hypothetical protein